VINTAQISDRSVQRCRLYPSGLEVGQPSNRCIQNELSERNLCQIRDKYHGCGTSTHVSWCQYTGALLQQLTLGKRVNKVPTRYMTMFTWLQQWSLASHSIWSFHLHPGLSTALFPSRTSTKITYGVFTVSRVSSVSIVTRLRAGRPRNCNLNPGRSNRFSSFAKRPDRSLVFCHCVLPAQQDCTQHSSSWEACTSSASPHIPRTA